MRRRLIAGAALLLLVAGMNVASAQGGRGRGGFGGGGLRMLIAKDVQDELKMTAPQIEKLDAKQKELQDLRQNSGFDFQNATQEERQKFQQKMQDAQTKAVGDILDAKQQKRFRQLELQQMGTQAFTRKDVADELKLTEDQKKKIGDIQQAQFAKMREMFQGGGGQNATPEEQQKMRQQMQELQRGATEKITAALTDAQKSQWKAMQGETFKFAPPAPRRP